MSVLTTFPREKGGESPFRVTQLGDGDIFMDNDGDYGVRTGDGWVSICQGFLMAYSDCEYDQREEFHKVIKRDDLDLVIELRKK